VGVGVVGNAVDGLGGAISAGALADRCSFPSPLGFKRGFGRFDRKGEETRRKWFYACAEHHRAVTPGEKNVAQGAHQPPSVSARHR